MEAIRNFTEEQINNAETLAYTIAKIPDRKRTMAVAIMNAYLDGLIAGQELETQKNESK